MDVARLNTEQIFFQFLEVCDPFAWFRLAPLYPERIRPRKQEMARVDLRLTKNGSLYAYLQTTSGDTTEHDNYGFHNDGIIEGERVTVFPHAHAAIPPGALRCLRSLTLHLFHPSLLPLLNRELRHVEIERVDDKSLISLAEILARLVYLDSFLAPLTGFVDSCAFGDVMLTWLCERARYAFPRFELHAETFDAVLDLLRSNLRAISHQRFQAILTFRVRRPTARRDYQRLLSVLGDNFALAPPATQRPRTHRDDAVLKITAPMRCVWRFNKRHFLF